MKARLLHDIPNERFKGSQVMISVSPLQMLSLWEKLMQCLYDDNRYGGTIAEIYIYSIMPYNPMIAANSNHKWVREDYALANKNLYDLCKLFEERLSTKLYVFELDVAHPLERLLTDLHTHCVHIGILADE